MNTNRRVVMSASFVVAVAAVNLVPADPEISRLKNGSNWEALQAAFGAGLVKFESTAPVMSKRSVQVAQKGGNPFRDIAFSDKG